MSPEYFLFFTALVHPNKADPAFEVTLVNATLWQHYGTPNIAGELQMTWNSSLIEAEKVNIELWGYREFNSSTQATINNLRPLQAELSYLYSLGKNLPNTGSFNFIPEPSKDYSYWELGNIRITTSSKSDGARCLLYFVSVHIWLMLLKLQVFKKKSKMMCSIFLEWQV